jgi:hypothetical protein
VLEKAVSGEDPVLRGKPTDSGISISGRFRIVGEESDYAPAFDTGWMKNCITYLGIMSILDRFGTASGDTYASVTSSLLTHAMINLKPVALGLGTGTNADYYLQNTLGSEVTYLLDSGARPIIDSAIINCPASHAVLTEYQTLIVAATVAKENICNLSEFKRITEIGLFNTRTVGTDYQLYSASTFPEVVISGGQAFTAFYSIVLNQTA